MPMIKPPYFTTVVYNKKYNKQNTTNKQTKPPQPPKKPNPPHKKTNKNLVMFVFGIITRYLKGWI